MPQVRYPVIPEDITVHLGAPGAEAENVTVPFADYVKNVDQTILCKKDNEEYGVFINDIFYIESVDKKVFIYCEKEVFGCNHKLYELEEALPGYFMRVSKSTIINVDKIYSMTKRVSVCEVEFYNSPKQVYVSRYYYKKKKKKLEEKRMKR